MLMSVTVASDQYSVQCDMSMSVTVASEQYSVQCDS